MRPLEKGLSHTGGIPYVLRPTRVRHGVVTVDAPDPAHGPAEREDRQPDQNHDQEGEDDVTRYCFHDARRLASSQAVCQL